MTEITTNMSQLGLSSCHANSRAISQARPDSNHSKISALSLGQYQHPKFPRISGMRLPPGWKKNCFGIITRPSLAFAQSVPLRCMLDRVWESGILTADT